MLNFANQSRRPEVSSGGPVCFFIFLVFFFGCLLFFFNKENSVRFFLGVFFFVCLLFFCKMKKSGLLHYYFFGFLFLLSSFSLTKKYEEDNFVFSAHGLVRIELSWQNEAQLMASTNGPPEAKAEQQETINM